MIWLLCLIDVIAIFISSCVLLNIISSRLSLMLQIHLEYSSIRQISPFNIKLPKIHYKVFVTRSLGLMTPDNKIEVILSESGSTFRLQYPTPIYLYKATNSFFLCPQRNFGRHIVIALSVRPSVSPSVRQSVRPAFVSGPYLLYSLR